MQTKNYNFFFLKHCSDNEFQKNAYQIQIVDSLINFYNDKKYLKNFFFNFFLKKRSKLGFYLFGDVGVGKTMILNFFFNTLDIPKKRMHFNEFMISFHDYCHNYKKTKKKNSLKSFVNKIKKNCKFLYLDEFQVTNIVDAMILGRLFKNIFNQNIKVLMSSNTSINDLYKDGLQRDQFLPFLKIIKNRSIEKELIIEEDYRKLGVNTLNRFFYPLNENTSFKINQIFRKLTKEKKSTIKTITVKGRKFKIKNYYEKIVKFQFDDLFDQNIGAEDFIKIAEVCDFIVIENIPVFNEENVNKQQRFIIFIDIVYEKKILLMASSEVSLEKLNQSVKLSKVFKRSVSRLYELTSTDFI